MTRHLAWAGAVDEDDMHDRYDQVRQQKLDLHICGICGGFDPDGIGECRSCWREAEPVAHCCCTHQVDDHWPREGCVWRDCPCLWWAP